VTRLFFRGIEQVNAPTANVAGRLFAANHWNGIVDPLVILTTARYVASPIAKSTLFSIPGFRQLLWIAGAVPVLRRKDAPDKQSGSNDAVFDRIAEHLARGGNVLIFPEGVSHTESQVLPVKSGAARMLCRALEKGARGLTLQAVALDFDARDTFRSRALVTYGPVHAVDDAAALCGAGEPLVRTLTDEVATDLAHLVVQGKSAGELMRIRQVAEILAHEAHGDTRSLAAEATIARGVFARAAELDAARYQAVVEAVDGYTQARAALGLTEEQVVRDAPRAGLARILRGLGLLVSAPFAVLGALLYQIPYRLPRWIAPALAHGELDVISTYKLAIGLIVFPLWMAGLLFLGIRFAPDSHGVVIHVLIVLLSPFAALLWVDRLDDHRGARLLRTASSAGVRDLARLRLLRRRALDAIEAARAA
jgi:1-acyl-sn-glycerol-3-phosphate acyltransferase